MAVATSEFKTGLKIEITGEPYSIVNFQHVKPGKGGAFVRTNLKNLRNGKVVEKTFRAGEKVGEPDIDERKMQFLYTDGDQLIFMDNETYEQDTVPLSTFEEQAKFLLDGAVCSLLYWNGQLIDVDPPQHVVMEITFTEPAAKGDTATNVTKPATVETGATVNVPAFINQGDKIKIDAITGAYIERVRG